MVVEPDRNMGVEKRTETSHHCLLGIGVLREGVSLATSLLRAGHPGSRTGYSFGIPDMRRPWSVQGWSTLLPSPAPTSNRRSSGRLCWVPRSFEVANAGASSIQSIHHFTSVFEWVPHSSGMPPSSNCMQLIRRLSPHVLGASERLLGGSRRNAFKAPDRSPV